MCLEHMIIQMTKCTYIATKRRTTKQFIDFLKRVEKSTIRIYKISFLYLIIFQYIKSKKAKEVLAKDCPRIKLVFLPVRSPELNLIEVRWLMVTKTSD